MKAPASYQLATLRGLQHKSNIYTGSVSPVVVAERRRKNKAARVARRVNRSSK